MIIRSFFLLISLLLFNSCKNDPPVVKSDETSQAEQEYFEDYEASQYKWGYIDRQGALDIEAIYDDCRDFSEGLALVNFEGRWGYINAKGENVIPHAYSMASSFKNNIAKVTDFDKNQFLIDKSGNKICKLSVDEVKDFNDGLAIARKGGLWGLINPQGEVVVPFNFEQLKRINDDAYRIKSGGKYGIVDRSGQMILDPTYDKISIEGLGPYVAKKEGKTGLIGADFSWKVTDYDRIFSFYTKRQTIAKSDGYVLIDDNGSKQGSLDFETVRPLGEGFWKFKKGDDWGIADHEGKALTEAKFKLLNRYHEGRLVFGLDDQHWGYLNELGQELVPAEYPLNWDFHNGLARIITRRGIGFIDKAGEIVIKPQFMEVKDFNEGLARVQVFR